MRLQKLGHSCLLVEQARSRLLIDPGCFSSGFEAFAGLTAVLVTHVHQDHLDADRLHALLERNPEAEVACDEASAALLAERGVKGQVVHDGDVLDLAMPVVGYLQTAAFLAVGLGTLGLAYVIRRLTAGSRGSLLGSVLIAVYGAGAIGSAVFPTDRIGCSCRPRVRWSGSCSGCWSPCSRPG